MDRTEEAKCCLCEEPLVHPDDPPGWKGGHSAYPAKDGRCCGTCNINIVIPARMRRVLSKEGHGPGL
jgi:hypothetical protein